MTAYHGGKQKIGKNIAKIISEISKDSEIKIEGYCEPFCGMLGVYQHIPLYFKNINYLAGDRNKDVIEMWKKVIEGNWIPPKETLTKHQYLELKYTNDRHHLRGFYGSLQSFRGIFFGSYFPHDKKKIENASENIQKISKELKDVKFYHGDYKQFSDLKNNVIYCDPPYSNTQQHYNGSFDSDEFLEWCKFMSQNNVIIVSEYNIDDKDFDCVWINKKEKLYTLQKNKKKLYHIL